MSRRLMIVSSLAVLASVSSPLAREVHAVDYTYVKNDSNVSVRQEVRANNTANVRLSVEITGTKTRVETDNMMEFRAANKEAHAAARAEFKEKMSELKDERKKNIIEKLDTRFAAVNKKATDHFTQVLDRMSAVLAKIKTKAVEAKAAGRRDTATLDADIVIAENLISSAKFEITQQADKEYVITLSTEDKLRMDVGKTASSLHADLRDVHKTVIEAKQAVMKAASDLAQLQK